MLRILRIAITAAVALLLFSAMLFQMNLANSYVDYPRVVDVAAGRVFPYAVKSVVVYVTRDEHLVLGRIRFIEILSGAALFACLVLDRLWPIRPKNVD